MRPGDTPGVDGFGFLFCRMRSISLKRPMMVCKRGKIVGLGVLSIFVGLGVRASAFALSFPRVCSVSMAASRYRTSVTGLKIHCCTYFTSYSSEIIRKIEVSLSAYAAFRRHGASISGLANV